jgi:hypothetical protein
LIQTGKPGIIVNDRKVKEIELKNTKKEMMVRVEW